MDPVLKKKREEDKYILNLAQYNEIVAEVKKHLKLFTYDDQKPTKKTDVDSIYMDSVDLVCFKKHVNGEDTRSKIRLRSYKNDGVPDDHFYVEIKEKISGQDNKSRFEIDAGNLAEIKRGQEIRVTPTIRSLNKGISSIDLRAIVDRLNTLVKMYNMKPSIEVSYEREAYGTEAIRVTFDRNIGFNPVGFKSRVLAQRIKDSVDWENAKAMAHRYKPGDVLLEVKHMDSDPEWLKDKVCEMGLEQQSFSKYVKACYTTISGLLKG